MEEKKDKEQKTKVSRQKTMLMVSLISLILVTLIVCVSAIYLLRYEFFGIKYSSTVSMDVSARYEIAGEVFEIDSFTFNPKEGEEQKSIIELGEISLTPEDSSIKITYSFVNTDDNGCYISLYDRSAKSNVKITYKVYINGQLVAENFDSKVLLPAGKTCAVVQTIEVWDEEKNAYYVSSSRDGGIYWQVVSAEDAEVKGE